MAERYAVGTGNWSNVATWNGGATLPQAGDTVHANNFTVTVDQDVVVSSLRTTAGTTAVAGGGFTMSTVHDVTAGTILAGSSTCLTISATSGTATITGNPTGSASTNVHGINITGAGCTVNVIGNPTGGGAAGALGVTCGVASTINITGNPQGGTASSAAGVNITSASAVVAVTGNVTGGSALVACGVHASIVASLTITGNITGGSNGGCGVRNATFAPIIVNGNLIAGSDGTVAANVVTLLIHSTNDVLHKYRVNNAGSAGVERILGAPLPAAADVRKGVDTGTDVGTYYGGHGAVFDLVA